MGAAGRSGFLYAGAGEGTSARAATRCAGIATRAGYSDLSSVKAL